METTVQTITFDALAEKLAKAEIIHIDGQPYTIGYVETDAYSKGDIVTELYIVFADMPYVENYTIRRSDNEQVECGADGFTYQVSFATGCDGEPEEAEVEFFTLTRI